MTTTSQPWTEQFVEIAGVRLHLDSAGGGDPVLVLHHDIGGSASLRFHDAMAATHRVVLPSHPGYDRSERPEWMRGVRDLAAVYQWLLTELGLSDVSLVGLGFGGWIAAEMASLAPRQFRRLVLAGAMGIQPERGEIFDQALVNTMEYVRTGFHDPDVFEQVFGEPDTDQLEQWEINREMTFRIAWRPYMYSQTLPHLLGGVRTPTLVVWGRQDRIVPLECGERYAALLPNARLEVVADCGHLIELEKGDELAALVTEFLAGR
jgi:pimeloyl-ACP methyl ester carboxylesterase